MCDLSPHDYQTESTVGTSHTSRSPLRIDKPMPLIDNRGMPQQEFSLPKLAARLRTEADAYLLLEELRWGGQPVCPHCGSVAAHYFLKPANGTSRKTRTGTLSERRVWKCRDCRKQFTVLVGTIFHGTKISIRTWLLVIFEFVSSKNSVSAWEISRKYEITNESAWHMLHRIREATKREPLAGLLSGAVQADEAWLGGNPKNRHRTDAKEPRRGPAHTDKQPVFALVHYETREVRSRVVPDVTGATLLPAMQEATDCRTCGYRRTAARPTRTSRRTYGTTSTSTTPPASTSAPAASGRTSLRGSSPS